MVYIDFDGVIIDSVSTMFNEMDKFKDHRLMSEEEKIRFIQDMDWNYILNNSEAINDSIYYLNQMNPKETSILTKVHSLNNEGGNKIKWARDNNIKQPLILVPYTLKKTDVVIAKGNTLIDDSIRNLGEWEENNGFPVLFDINDDGFDSWNMPNTKEYQRVRTLSKFTDRNRLF